MIPQGFAYRRHSSDRHWLLGCTAVLLSAVVHVAVVYLFADWTLTGTGRLARRGRELFASDRVPPMRVETMRADPMRLADKVVGERDTPSRGPIEVSDQVDELSQAASPALLAPPPIPREALAPGVPSLKESPVGQTDTTPWMPRQEIAQIFDRTVQDAVAALPRREIPMIERVPDAPDIVPSIDLVGRRFGKDPEPPRPIKAAEVFDTEIKKGTFAEPVPAAPGVPTQVSKDATETRFGVQPGEKSGRADGAKDGAEASPSQQEMLDKGLKDAERALSDEERRAREAQAKIDSLRETIDYVPIDDLLSVALETYRDPAEPGRVYFRIAIQPRTDKPVPTIAKDIVWVQDVSASMTEERVLFCRRALLAALETMNPQDRFTVIAFRETFSSCFLGWTAVSDESKRKAAQFISGMTSFGQTDVFGSLESLLKLPRDPRRPMIAFVVTDGMPTFGMTESAKIISAFSRLNNGLISVYMYGTHAKANAYLLDMLTYCNRGESSVLSGNRWDIPATMAKLYEGIRNPVMGDVTVAFDTASKAEVYPKNTTNLYKDRPLELLGSCSDGAEELVFQVRGLAFDKGYDSIFRLNLARHAKLGTPALKTRWAQQKMFHLVAAYSRDPQQQTFAEMLNVNKQYGVEIPYKSELK